MIFHPESTNIFNNYRFTLIENRFGEKRAIIDEYLGTEEEIFIPSMLDGVTVKEIGVYAFADNDQLRRVIIPDTVTVIDNSAFSGCSKLLQVRLPDQLVSLGPFAFSGCTELKDITIPQKIQYVEYGNFNKTKLPYNITGKKVFLPLQYDGPSEELKKFDEKCPYLFFLYYLAENPDKWHEAFDYLYQSAVKKKTMKLQTYSGGLSSYIDIIVIELHQPTINMESALLRCGIKLNQNELNHIIDFQSEIPLQQLNSENIEIDDSLRVTEMQMLASKDFYHSLGNEGVIDSDGKILIEMSQYEKLIKTLSSFEGIPGIQIDFGEYVLEHLFLIGQKDKKIVIKDYYLSD